MHSYPIARRCVIRPVRVCVVAVGCVWRVRYSPLTDTSMAPRSAHWAPRTDSSRSFPQYIIQPFKYQSCKRPTEEPPAHRRRRSSWRRMEVEKRANGYEYPDRNNAKSVNGRWRSLHLQWGLPQTQTQHYIISLLRPHGKLLTRAGSPLLEFIFICAPYYYALLEDMYLFIGIDMGLLQFTHKQLACCCVHAFPLIALPLV